MLLHIATAIQIGAPVLEHYDDDDIGKVGQRVATEKLTGFPEIRHPKWIGQLEACSGRGQRPAGRFRC